MSLITTDNGRRIFKEAESMMVVPYVYDSASGNYVLGSDVYDLSAIIGDSITIEQEDGDRSTKNNEFVSTPLIECVSGTKYKFSAQCIDLQNDVLRSCFNVMTASASGEQVVAFGTDYALQYVLIRIRFRNSNAPDLILPKVQLNSKMFVNQLKTRMAQGNLEGSALGMNIAVLNSSNTNALAFSNGSSSTYFPFAPVVILPRDRKALFFHHRGSGDADIYSYVNFATGVVSNDTQIIRSSGAVGVSGGGNEGEGEGGNTSN